MSALDRTMCRLRVSRWMAEEAQATIECVQAIGRRDKVASKAAEAWAELCGLRVQAWKEEAEKP